MAYKPTYTTYRYPSYNNPDKLPSPIVVAKISAKALTGNYFDIKKAMLEERSTLNITDQSDDSKNTILHNILLNSNLDKSDKAELVKMAIELGAPIDHPNKRFIRPLHLASSQQNKMLVKLLLEKGADPNSSDDMSMTPLHHAIQPEIIPCKPSKLKRIDPEQKLSLEGKTDEIANNVYEFMKTDPHITTNMKHIAKLFGSLVLQKSFSDTKKDTSDFIRNAFEKEQGIGKKLEEKLIKLRDAVAEKTKQKFQAMGIERLDIKEDEGGSNDWKKVLPYSESKDICTEMIQDYEKILQNNLNNSDKAVLDLTQSIEKLELYLINTQKFLTSINLIRFFILTMDPTNQTYPEYVDIINTLIEGLDVPNQELLKNLITTSIGTNQVYDYETSLIDDTPLPGNITVDSTFFKNLNIDGTSSTYGHILAYYLETLYQLKDEITTTNEDLTRNINNFTDNFNDLQNYVNTIIKQHNKSIDVAYTCIIVEKILKMLNDVINVAYEGISNDDDIKNNMDEFFKLMVYIKTDYQQNQQKNKPQTFTIIDNRANPHRVKSNTAVLINNAFYVYQVNDKIYVHAPNPNPAFGHFAVANPGGGPVINLSYPYVLDELIMDIKKFKTIIDDSKRKEISIPTDIYNKANVIIESTNKFLVEVNLSQANRFVVNYNNNCNDDALNDDKIIPINNFIDSPLAPIKKLPNYDEFKKLGSSLMDKYGDIIKDKSGDDRTDEQKQSVFDFIKKIFESYVYQLTDDNNIIVYTSDAIGADVDIVKKNGFMYLNMNDDMNITLFKLKDKSNGVIGNYQIMNYQYFNDAVVANKKEEVSPSIVSLVIEYHFKIMRYNIVRYVFAHIDHDASGINYLINEIRAMSDNLNPESIGYTLVGRIIDSILITSIENMSNISASIYIKDIMKKNNINDKNNIFKVLGTDKIETLLLKPKKISRMQNDPYIQKVITEYIGTSVPKLKDVEMLQFFGNPYAEIQNKENRILNLEKTSYNDDICYSIDEDVVAELISKGSNVNAKNNAGSTPLELAVYLQNESIVDELLKAGSSVNYVFNGTNKNVYQFCFDQLLQSIGINFNAYVTDNEDIAINHLKTNTGMDILPKNCNYILKMTLYMLNHQISANANMYPNMYSYQDHKKILAMTGLSETTKDILPLATVDKEIFQSGLSGYHAIKDTLEVLSRQLVEERDIYMRLDNSIKNMNSELKSLDPKNTFRIEEIKQIKLKLMNEKMKTNHKAKKIMDNMKQLNKPQNVDNQIDTFFNRLKTFNVSKRNVSKIYDLFFSHVSNVTSGSKEDIYKNQYNAYIKMWRNLFSRSDAEMLKDHTQIVYCLQKYITNKGIISAEHFSEYAPIVNLYRLVLAKYGKDYFELSTYLKLNATDDYNYVLKQIVGIIEHVFSHTMSIDFINIVSHLLVKYDRGEETSEKLQKTFKTLQSIDFINYCIKVLPLKVIKISLKISEGENDPDMSSNITDELNFAIERLKLNTMDGIDKEFVDTLQGMIIPFFKEYMEVYTTEMHRLIIIYLKSLIDSSKWLNILAKLSLSQSSN